MIASKESFASIVDSIPANLEMTYRNFLSSVPRGHEQLAASLLRLVLGSMRPLTLDEINIAFTIEWEEQSTAEVLPRCHFAISNLLQETLGPLVRISDSSVSLIHQTAKKFLLCSSTEVGIDDLPVRVNDCDLQLSTVCIRYLLVADFSEDILSPDSSSSDTCSTRSLPGSGDRVSEVSLSANLWEGDAPIDYGVMYEHPLITSPDVRERLATEHKSIDMLPYIRQTTTHRARIGLQHFSNKLRNHFWI
jgi:hypothetical protein